MLTRRSHLDSILLTDVTQNILSLWIPSGQFRINTSALLGLGVPVRTERLIMYQSQFSTMFPIIHTYYYYRVSLPLCVFNSTEQDKQKIKGVVYRDLYNGWLSDNELL